MSMSLHKSNAKMTHEFAHCIVHMNNLYLKNNFDSAYRTYSYELCLIMIPKYLSECFISIIN